LAKWNLSSSKLFPKEIGRSAVAPASVSVAK
jgi:hypothetical protein